MKHGIIVTVLLCVAAASAWGQATTLLDPATEYKQALEAEKSGDLTAALLHWENLNDSCEIDTVTRFQAVDRIRKLRSKVPVDPNKKPGNTWTCLVLVYKNIDFEWTDQEGKKQHVVTKMSDEDIAEVRRAVDNFAAHVLKYTSREMRLTYEFRVVERTLTDLAGRQHQRFWLAPPEVVKDMQDMEFAAYDSVFTYTKMQQKKDGPRIPGAFAGGAYGADYGPKGCGYTTILLSPGNLTPESRDGEIELHEWLHQVDWMFVTVQGYPDEIVPTPDAGRMEGQFGGDPDFRRTPEMKNWMPFYVHIMQDHITRRMWRGASMDRNAETAWSDSKLEISEWLVLGPFEKTGGKTFATPFINEAAVKPRPGLKVAGKQWRAVQNTGTLLGLDTLFKPNDNVVAYAHVYVQSDEAQRVQLRLGSDDGAAVWHNGQLIYFTQVARAAQTDENIVDVMLTQGQNRFLFKVDEIGGQWALIARLTTPGGDAVPGIRCAVIPDPVE